MKVGIFETDHYEGAYPVIKLFDIPSNELVIFTTPATYQRFADLFKDDMKRYTWVILDNTRSRYRFFQQLYIAAKAHRLQLFYINTISNNHLFFAWVLKRLGIPRLVLTLHDINCMFNSEFSLHPRKLAHHLGKKQLIRLIPEFNVVSDTMMNYLAGITGGMKIIHNIPGAVFEGQHQPVVVEDHLHLVIPGSIDKKRRDYEQVFALLQLAEERKIPLQVTLLGGYTDEYGKTVVQRAAGFKTGTTKITYYRTDVVTQHEFDRQLNAAHFIFIPSVIETAICFDIPETYGVTKSSGNIFDVIKHAKPFIVPQALQVPATLESSCYRYTSVASLLDWAVTLLQQPTVYAHWQQQSVDNSGFYTIDAVREKNIRLLQGN